MKESLKVIQLLRSLPESYHVLVASLIVHFDQNLQLSLEETFQKIKTFSTLDRNFPEETPSALATQTGTRRARTEPTPEQLKLHPCTYCNTFGHWWKDCPKRKQDHQRNLASPPASPITHHMETEDDTHVMTATFTAHSSSEWIVDTGASHHISSSPHFLHYSPFKFPKRIYQGSGEPIYALGKGDLTLTLNFNGQPHQWHLSDVLYVPNFKFNVIAPVLLRNSTTMTLTADRISFTDINTSRLIASATLGKANLYFLDLHYSPQSFISTNYSWRPNSAWTPSLPRNRRRTSIFKNFRQFVTGSSSVLRSR
jgi:hypothetical protein